MQKTILITGATDGIGFQTATKLAKEGDRVLIHGRNAKKLATTQKSLEALVGEKNIQSYLADLSNLEEVKTLAKTIMQNQKHIDVLINNAGIYKTPSPITKDKLDIRFVVNTIAPYLLTKELLPLLDKTSRVVNLSSAAQAPVGLDALQGKVVLSDSEAYAQSKLALTMWSNYLAHNSDIGVVVAINPASFLGSKMVKEAYSMSGKPLSIGADILTRASLSDAFATANGKYFDNDIRAFASPHPDALDMQKCKRVVDVIEEIYS